MKIDLRQLDESSGRVSGSDRVEFTDAAGVEASVNCAVDVAYNHAGGTYTLHVRSRGRYETACHRCLEPAVVPLDVEFDVVIRRGVDRDDDRSESQYITVGSNEHEVSLHPMIRENLVVDVPMLILCSEDCRGLCPQCGTNLNHATCACTPAPDPRWEALRHLGNQ